MSGSLQQVDRGTAPKVDVGKALELRLKGMTLEEIGNKYGVSKQAISKRLSKFTSLIEDPESIRAYQENQVDLLRAVDRELLVGIIDKIHSPKSTVNNLAYAKDKIFTHIRLLEGNSTANIHNLTSIIEAVHGKRDLPADNQVIEAEVVDK